VRRLGNRVGVVTGASRGIGKAIAHAGCHSVVNYETDHVPAPEVVAGIREIGWLPIAVPARVSLPTDVEKLAEATLSPPYRLLGFDGGMT
jgi:NAD(P)-dependent dehydrogenase (short-subunit alcohol dehydrogenase family)